MEKIAIVGSSGAGKTTLAKKLEVSLRIKAFHLDRFFWRRDWERIDGETRIDTLQKLVQRQRWIIEGSYINSSSIHLDAADTIIFLDFLPFICLGRIIKRHFIHEGRFRLRRGMSWMKRKFSQQIVISSERIRRDIPEGCTDKLSLLLMLKVLFFPFQERIKLEISLGNYSSEKVIQLHSRKEVKKFLKNPEQYVQIYRQFVEQQTVLREAFTMDFGYFSYVGYSQQRVLDTSQQVLDMHFPSITSS